MVRHQVHNNSTYYFNGRISRVCIKKSLSRPHHLKFCLASSSTAATVLIPDNTEGELLEIRPQAQVIAENMAENIANHGGCSLIVDYGDVQCDRYTLRVSIRTV